MSDFQKLKVQILEMPTGSNRESRGQVKQAHAAKQK